MRVANRRLGGLGLAAIAGALASPGPAIVQDPPLGSASSTGALAQQPSAAAPSRSASGSGSAATEATRASPLEPTTLASRYPGDAGIEADPALVWHERFDEGSVDAIASRYDSHANVPGMAIVTDRRPAAAGALALQLTAGGAAPATDLYKSFATGLDEVYLRYYVKYVDAGPWSHSGVSLGGYDPPLQYPFPRAGTRPSGADRFSIALEPWSSTADTRLDFYAYWMKMRSWKATPTGAANDFYGNTLVHDADLRNRANTWTCYEVHLKLNEDPASGRGAVLELWRDDALIRRFDDRGPPGFLNRDEFCANDATGRECTDHRPERTPSTPLDQEWRSTLALKINFLWVQNYNTSAATSALRVADIVLATRRIGCMVSP